MTLSQVQGPSIQEEPITRSKEPRVATREATEREKTLPLQRVFEALAGTSISPRRKFKQPLQKRYSHRMERKPRKYCLFCHRSSQGRRRRNIRRQTPSSVKALRKVPGYIRQVPFLVMIYEGIKFIKSLITTIHHAFGKICTTYIYT